MSESGIGENVCPGTEGAIVIARGADGAPELEDFSKEAGRSTSVGLT